ncbi:cytochrome C biogenesis protein CcdA, partial [Klebsiella aerogenes]
IFKDGFINKVQLDELTARGGIGEILGRFIDADGGVV